VGAMAPPQARPGQAHVLTPRLFGACELCSRGSAAGSGWLLALQHGMPRLGSLSGVLPEACTCLSCPQCPLRPCSHSSSRELWPSSSPPLAPLLFIPCCHGRREEGQEEAREPRGRGTPGARFQELKHTVHRQQDRPIGKLSGSEFWERAKVIALGASHWGSWRRCT